MSAALLKLPRNPSTLPPAELTDIELADQIGEHDRQYSVIKPMIDRRAELKEEAQIRCAEQEANAETKFEGKFWRVTVGARSWVTFLPGMKVIHQLYKAAKKDFYAAISITQKQFEADLGEEALEKAKRKEQTGYRKVTAVLKEQPKAS